jgi:hypothetical protein
MAIGVTVVLIAFVIFIIPKYPKMKKVALSILCFIIVAESLFFIIRPFWIDYQQDVKVELLNQYLEERYPGETWEVYRNDMPSHPRYVFGVRFANDEGWSYGYSVKDNADIFQTNIGTPPNSSQFDGNHFEPDTYRMN